MESRTPGPSAQKSLAFSSNGARARPRCCWKAGLGCNQEFWEICTWENCFHYPDENFLLKVSLPTCCAWDACTQGHFTSRYTNSYTHQHDAEMQSRPFQTSAPNFSHLDFIGAGLHGSGDKFSMNEYASVLLSGVVCWLWLPDLNLCKWKLLTHYFKSKSNIPMFDIRIKTLVLVLVFRCTQIGCRLLPDWGKPGGQSHHCIFCQANMSDRSAFY